MDSSVFRLRDPRPYQIVILSGLLTYGVLALGFDVEIGRVAVLMTTAVATQFALTRLFRLPIFDARSALISSLSLALLLRTPSHPTAVAIAAIAVASKFLLRWQGRHVFNPTAFGLVVALVFFDDAWISPGQWGSGALVAFAAACLGTFVVHRSARSDVTWAFLLFYVTALISRALWLGDPMTVPLHSLQNGALVLFAFFMISDPKTTPDSRAGRVMFALLVAVGAAWIHLGLHGNNGFVWALIPVSLLTPVINHFLPGRAFQWTSAPNPGSSNTGENHETTHAGHFGHSNIGGGHRSAGAELLRVLRGQGRREAIQQGIAGGSGTAR